MTSFTSGGVDLLVDNRRRISLARVTHDLAPRYIAELRSDGSILLRPARTALLAELTVLEKPETQAAISEAFGGDPNLVYERPKRKRSS